MKMKKIVCTVVQCFLIIGMMCASLPLPLQASASTTDSMPLENGIYYIKNLNCNKYLDLKPGVAAQMFAFNGTACQQWKVSGSNGVYQSTDNVELSNYNGLNSLWSLETVDRHDSDLFCFPEFGIGISGTCYSDYVGAMGYLPYYHTDASRDTAFDYLQTASMWIHNGHGAPGIAAFMNGQRITATNIHALPHNELGGLRCFITMGCEGGSTDSNGLNLVKAAYYRGAKFALGFEHTQYTGVVDTWLVRFLERSSQGKNIQTSLQYADLVANLPYFGTGVKYYLGDTYQCLSR